MEATMRKVNLFVLLLSVVFTAVGAFGQTPAPITPEKTGFYILNGQTYQALLPAPIQATQPKVGRAIISAYTFGAVGNRVVIIIPSETSPVPTGERPTFLLVNPSDSVAS